MRNQKTPINSTKRLDLAKLTLKALTTKTKIKAGLPACNIHDTKGADDTERYLTLC